MDDEVLVTPELQRWARTTASRLQAAGRRIPVDLEQVANGRTVTRLRWLWMVDEVLNPRPWNCPF